MNTPAPRDACALSGATALCFLLPLGLYALTAARTIQGGDAGELAVVAALGGVAHPPGYPLFTLCARALLHLPFGPLYWRIAMTSALCGAGCVAVLFRVLVRLTGSVSASLLTALAFGVSSLQWRLAGVPEVFAMNALAIACVIWLVLRVVENSVRWSLPLGLGFGLALANHHSAVLVAPLLVWALYAIRRQRPALAFGLFCVGAAVGLLPYLLLMSWPGSASIDGSTWGRTDTWSGLVHHFLRRDYGTTSMAAGNALAPYDPARHIGAFFTTLPGEYAYLFFLAGLPGFAAALREKRGIAGALLATLVMSGVVFPALFNVRDSPTNQEVAERFHLMPDLLFAPFVAFGLTQVQRRLKPRLVLVLALAALVLGAARSFVGADWARDSSIERMARAEVEGTAPHALILGRGDTEGPSINWVTHVLHDRPDVHFVDVHLMAFPWYVERKERETGIHLPPARVDTEAGLIATELARVTPTYLLSTLAVDASNVATLEPSGFLDRVVASGTPPITLEERRARLEKASATYGVPGPAIDAWADEIHIAAGYAWLSLGDALKKAGRDEEAKAAEEKGDLLLPLDWH